MNLSRNWLQDFVTIPKTVSPEELGEQLTLSIVEIEGIEKQAETLADVVVGKITSITKHPDADKLRVTTVDVGTETLNIVCGAPNISVGMLVPVALVGAQVRWHGKGDLVTLAKTKIRGVESKGMICAAEEIGIADYFPVIDGIVDLSAHDVRPGQPLASALGLDDVIYDLDNKSITHRPDLWGHYGMAREVAAIYNKTLKPVEAKPVKSKSTTSLKIEVDEPELCPRYMAIKLDNIKVEPSPYWLSKRLAAAGVRSINNIVDVTNYVLMELGQPMHAFDAEKLSNETIIVRNALAQEKIKSLDGEERELDTDMLVIADDKKPIAVAGVIGSANTEVDDSTKSIILESANFDPVSVRKTSLRLGVRTESSARFEKGQDPANAATALWRAVNLIQQLIPEAEAVSKSTDLKKYKLFSGPIKISQAELETQLGTTVDLEKVTKKLSALGFETKKSGDSLAISVPSWRSKEVDIPEDIVEEVARMIGYDAIPTILPTVPIIPAPLSKEKLIERKVKRVLSGIGLSEVMLYSFVNPELVMRFDMLPKNHIALLNTISEEHTHLRQSLIPNLVKAVEDNSRFYDDVAIFELGRVFYKEDSETVRGLDEHAFLPKQPIMLSAAFTEHKNDNPYPLAARAVQALAEALRLEIRIQAADQPAGHMHPTRSAQVLIGQELIGHIAELHPRSAKKFDLLNRLAFFELDFAKLVRYASHEFIAKDISQFPAVVRDLAMIMPREVYWGDFATAIKEVDPLVASIELFDVFESAKIGEGLKSVAFHIKYQHAERTLTAEEVDELQTKIFSMLKEKFKAELRGTKE